MIVVEQQSLANGTTMTTQELRNIGLKALADKKMRSFRVYGILKGDTEETYLGGLDMVCYTLRGIIEAKKVYSYARKLRVVEYDRLEGV